MSKTFTLTQARTCQVGQYGKETVGSGNSSNFMRAVFPDGKFSDVFQPNCCCFQWKNSELGGKIARFSGIWFF